VRSQRGGRSSPKNGVVSPAGLRRGGGERPAAHLKVAEGGSRDPGAGSPDRGASPLLWSNKAPSPYNRPVGFVPRLLHPAPLSLSLSHIPPVCFRHYGWGRAPMRMKAGVKWFPVSQHKCKMAVKISDGVRLKSRMHRGDFCLCRYKRIARSAGLPPPPKKKYEKLK